VTLIELTGWIAAAFTLAAFGMRTMLPLRLAGIGANLAFIVYGALTPLYPVLVLHIVLLPFNGYRLWEILRARKRLKGITAEADVLEALGPYLSLTRFADGARVFAKGDRPDHLYILKSGTVLLEEIDVTLAPGDIFGEIAFFTDARERTVSARCVGAARSPGSTRRPS